MARTSDIFCTIEVKLYLPSRTDTEIELAAGEVEGIEEHIYKAARQFLDEKSPTVSVVVAKVFNRNERDNEQ